MNLEAEDVQEILHLLEDLEVDELHLRTERFSLRLRRSGDGAWTQQAEVLPPPDASPPPPAAAAAAPADRPPSAPGRAGLREVGAPLPGTFYRAPRPGAPAFVEVGDRVEEDTVVGIVETMKLMNSVLAGVRGTVAEICLANGELAEQGAVLLRIEPEVP